MQTIHVIHENDAWVAPLRAAFAEIGARHREWFLDHGVLDLRDPPPAGVYYNRMSASSHTRGHRHAVDYTAAVLAWLERHGRVVVNDSRALRLEVSKVAQYQALAVHGIATPDTLAAIGKRHVFDAARRLGFPLILKHNRGGKGLGVRLLRDPAALARHLESPGYEEPIDGVVLVQRYVESPEPYITRAEFVGGKFLYAVRVDTSQGFELCPADQCQIEAAGGAAGTGLADVAPASAPAARFRIVEGFDSPLIPRYEAFLAANGIGVAGIEFVRDREGRAFTYDVNTNTNYNPEAEALASQSGMRAIARHLAALAAEEAARLRSRHAA
ncbi:MAG: alpha-L-glutamate ligase [Alphaproteobacteria bacterium]|nr:alpha-L-glutamate ligase [Alphaproteobacteria bacterium]